MKPKKSTQGNARESHLKTSSKTFRVITTSRFIKEAKNLKKKYPNIKEDFVSLNEKLQSDPITGNVSLGKGCYKVRMSISDKGCGESSGARVIIQAIIQDEVVYLLSVYDKSTRDTYTNKEIATILKHKFAISEDSGGW
ncbi:hypothetical protein [Chitinophaga flava]|uniref:Addiction module toxin RelE n=1 Tax=Chitinophaga flava TaxID=2259036 RepID=A0A365Y229_9BACT|nr:hypothetical protein [Chitinophaga flava]RBL92672.1 hypothetical protein DF182_08865 [Chitinophaga flava]